MNELTKRIIAAVREQPGASQTAIRKAVPGRSSITQARVLELIEEGVLENRGTKNYLRCHIGEKAPEYDVEHPPTEPIDRDELVERRKTQFARKRQYEKENALIRVKVHIGGPVAILHFGDPHVDDDGTDIEALERHTDLVRRTEGFFAGNVGDTTNNWVGRLARLYGQQSTSAAEGWVLAEWFIGRCKWLYMVAGNHDCHDTMTETLTRLRGWLPPSELSEHDEVLGLDSDGRARWQPIDRIIRKRHTGKLLEVENSQVSLAVTPRHRILHRKRDYRREWGELRYTHAEDMSRTRVAIPQSGNGPEREAVDLTADQLRLAAWILTDGTIRRDAVGVTRIEVYQRRSNADSVEATLRRCGVVYTRSERTRGITSVCGRELVKEPEPEVVFRIGANEARRWSEKLGMPNKYSIPAWAWLLTDRQFEEFLSGMVDGDGTWKREGEVGAFYGRRTFVDQMQGLCVAHGYAASVYTYRGDQYRLNISRRNETQLDWKPREVPYDGEVWCLQVPLSNFMVRRNGRAHFSGNCWSGAGDPLHWIARQNGALYKETNVRLALDFPNGREVRVNVRHDFTGHSMWNPAHGSMRAAQQGVKDHILVNGHKHVTGYGIIKDGNSGLISHCIQVGSYKIYDRYAKEKGFRDQTVSPCAVTVIDPSADDVGLVQVFWDPELAADFLTWLRKKRKAA